MTLLPFLLLPAFPFRLAGQCPDGSPPPCARPTGRTPPPNSVAVLYFDNLSRDTADAYLADGLTEEIIVRLGQIHRIEVKSRYEVQRFRGRSGSDPAALSGQLGAANIVTGSLQRAGNHVRVRVELMRASNHARIWGDVFDRSSDDVLTIEEQIAGAVVLGVAGQLLPEERATLDKRPTSSAAAYDLYLRGRAAMLHFNEPSLRRAIGLFEQAVALDSGFALADAGIAQSWTILADDWVPPLDAYPQARAAAERAIRADSSNAEAWANLAAVAFWFDWTPARAESLAQRALALDGRSSRGHLIYAEALRGLGSGRDASIEYQRAFDLDSLAEETLHEASLGLWAIRRYDLGVAIARRFQQSMPSNPAGFEDEGEAYLVQGDCPRALPALRRARELGDSDFYDVVGLSLCEEGEEAARQLIDARVQSWQQNRSYFRAGLLALLYALLGDRDKSFLWLERAFAAREATLSNLESARWDALRDDPRFTDLVRRVRESQPEDR